MRRPRTTRCAAAVLGTVLAGSLLVAAPSPSLADPAERKRLVEQGIAELQQDLEGTSAELAEAAVALQATQVRLPAAEAELAEATATVEQARARDAELAGRLDAATQSEAKAKAAIEAGEADIDATHREVGRIASQAYREGNLTPGLAVALSAQSPADFADRYVMVDTAMRTQNGALARLGEQQALRAHAEARLAAVRDEVDRLKQEAAANLKVARAAEADAAARKAEVEDLLAQQAAALAVVEARKAEEMSRLDALESERAALMEELRRIEEERRRAEEAAAEEARRRAAAEARAGSEGSGGVSARGREAPAPSGDGTLSFPVNARISSHYGFRIHPIYKTRRLHAGTDFAASCGTPVRAAADGTVVRAGANGGFGNQVVVHHGTLAGQGVASSYNHLSGYAVRSGSVSRGEVIGYVGTTGTSTGCHLHFEVYVNGATVNPMGWL